MQGYLNEFVTVDEDPLVVDYTNFDPARLEIDAPKDGESQKGDKFFSCRFRYRYLRKDGTEQVSMLKVRGPIGWAHGGVLEKIDKETKLGTGKYSYPMEISSAEVEGKGFLDLLDKLYKRILSWYLENKKSFPRKGATEVVASKKDPVMTDNHVLFGWEGCSYPYKIQLPEGQEDKIPDVYTTSFWSQVVTDGKYATKFYDVEPVMGADDQPERDESGRIKTVKKRLGPEVYMEAAIKGRPIWIFRDWFVGAKLVIRKKLDSVLVSALAPKTQGFQMENDAADEAERRIKATVDPIKSMIDTILKSTYGKKPQHEQDQKNEVGNATGFGESTAGNAFKNNDPFKTAAPTNSKQESDMKTPMTVTGDQQGFQIPASQNQQPPMQQTPTQFNPQASVQQFNPNQPQQFNPQAGAQQFNPSYTPSFGGPYSQGFDTGFQGFGGQQPFDAVMAANQRT